ncbi:hypothetical protein HLB44_18680 [Aquincola sp. S2]|uniref:Uncharacterized protein n=1 Tax=Pseudaquabacterium terrae TaxID=2732868 RepID=A0ABX2EK90_9BURK|nr:hypothetical protein [Aquabacterium terrae]NRF69023.1 hypothetical protein [Aquabacterium terrae]
MTRKTLWQLSAIAAAATVMGIAQAQSDNSVAANEVIVEQRVATEAKEMAAEPVMTPEQAATYATTEATTTSPSITETTITTTTTTTTSVPQSTTIVVVPTQVDHVVVAAKAWAAVEAEPTTREEVVSEAVYANKNGLIPRGEMNAANEDKGTIYLEMGDQARHERSTKQYYAKVDSRHQQFAAAEQERLNQLALQEQQRQQALAAEQAQQQQQLAQQEQPKQ